MQKLSGLRGLEGFRSLVGSTSMAMKAPNPKPSSDAGGSTYGSFANLKITAEKLVKEQASVKTDLEMAHTKLRRATEQISLLEGKLQQAVNENVKFKVKQTEDSKLWQGLDSKLSSTKTLCDQLTETLQQLASHTERAEEDKKFFEKMIGKNSKSLDEFNCLLHDLSTKLECAEQKIISGKQEMLQIKQEKEEMDRSYKERLYANDTTLKEKDFLIKQLEGSVDENKSRFICLDSRLQCMEQELKLKDDVCISLKENLASTESEKNDLELRNQGCRLEIEKLCKDNKDLNELLRSFMARITELDKEHASMSSHVSRLLSSFERFYGMVQEEQILIARSSKDKFEHLQNQYADLTSENNALKIEIEELKSRIIELQKTQEIVMVQHVEECQVAEDKIRRLESEAEISASNINRLEKSASELQGRILKLLEDSTLAENHKQESLQKILKLESDNQELLGRVQSIMDEKSNNAESLQGEIAKRDQQVDTLENQVKQLRSVLDEKEQLYSCSVEREQTLEEQKLQVEASLAAIECQLTEAKKQYDLMLEGKQIELSKHLKELSLKNDQAINEIRKKYELEKIEITNAEKEKAEKLIQEMENKCNEKISENKQDSETYLMRLKEEHGEMMARIQHDNEHKESTLRAYHKEELQRIQSQAENELRESLSLLKKEHELQIRSLRMQHEDECQRLQEELELQKSKEEKQRTLLQLQWKVMGENQQVDQEVNSKKEYSVSSMKRRDPYGRKEHELQLVSPETKRKDVNLSGILQSPISNMLRKVEKGSQDIPKHRKVTHHEYEVETANGRITKRRKTRSTFMFGEANTQKALPSAADKDVTKMRKVAAGSHAHPANIGELFSEGSLNPYADDPYAFD
ncbi:synaptonemal complex protein ZEP1-like [Phragmites australis]|uniref:synaptonemal complex protein ZEP1-like n=1 Tax=Phragmites australis TaxID=29695 RepID=UPI002D764B11|nr:synaptonemal complex protein ZEP1-like [Phragmites australis]